MNRTQLSFAVFRNEDENVLAKAMNLFEHVNYEDQKQGAGAKSNTTLTAAACLVVTHEREGHLVQYTHYQGVSGSAPRAFKKEINRISAMVHTEPKKRPEPRKAAIKETPRHTAPLTDPSTSEVPMDIDFFNHDSPSPSPSPPPAPDSTAPAELETARPRLAKSVVEYNDPGEDEIRFYKQLAGMWGDRHFDDTARTVARILYDDVI